MNKDEKANLATALIKKPSGMTDTGRSHYLIGYKDWQDARSGGARLRSATMKLDELHLLCPVSTLEHMNVLVFYYALTRGSSMKKEIFKFVPGNHYHDGDTDTYGKHSVSHVSTSRAAASV